MVEVTKEEKDFFKKVEPIEKRVIIKRDVLSKAGIIMAEASNNFKAAGVVVAASPECVYLKVGDVVGWSKTTICEQLYFDELKELDSTGIYNCIPETYLAFKLK